VAARNQIRRLPEACPARPGCRSAADPQRRLCGFGTDSSQIRAGGAGFEPSFPARYDAFEIVLFAYSASPCQPERATRSQGGTRVRIWLRPSSWWKFGAVPEGRRSRRRQWKCCLRSVCRRAAIDGRPIVLRPPCRYQALRLRRTAARLRGLTAALRPSVWHPCLRRCSGSLEAGDAAHGIWRGSDAPAAAASSAIASTCI
jgi:hypothetical protein